MREISVTGNFQGHFPRTFQDQSDFPGLSRSWNFKDEKSRTFPDFPGGVGTLINTGAIAATMMCTQVTI